jgi:hypothetical protein
MQEKQDKMNEKIRQAVGQAQDRAKAAMDKAKGDRQKVEDQAKAVAQQARKRSSNGSADPARFR